MMEPAHIHPRTKRARVDPAQLLETQRLQRLVLEHHLEIVAEPLGDPRTARAIPRYFDSAEAAATWHAVLR